MKSFIKVCLQISAIFLAIGIVLCIIGAGLGAVSGFKNMVRNNEFSINFGDNDDYEYDGSQAKENSSEKTYVTSEIQSLSLDIKYGEVYINSYDGSDIKVETQNVSSDYKASQKDGVLSISDNQKKYNESFDWGIFHDDHHPIINVYIPKEMKLDEVTLKMGAGEMGMEELAANKLNIDVGAGEFTGNAVKIAKQSDITIGTGEFTLEDTTLNNLTLECGAGEANLSGTLTGENSLKCSVGSVNLETLGKKTDFNYEIKCGVGDVRIGDSDYSGLGNYENVDNNAEQNLTIDCGVGSVTVEFND